MAYMESTQIAIDAANLDLTFKFVGTVIDLAEINDPKVGDVVYSHEDNGQYVYTGTDWSLLDIDLNLHDTAKKIIKVIPICDRCGAPLNDSNSFRDSDGFVQCKYCGCIQQQVFYR